MLKITLLIDLHATASNCATVTVAEHNGHGSPTNLCATFARVCHLAAVWVPQVRGRSVASRLEGSPRCTGASEEAASARSRDTDSDQIDSEYVWDSGMPYEKRQIRGHLCPNLCCRQWTIMSVCWTLASARASRAYKPVQLICGRRVLDALHRAACCVQPCRCME